MIGPTHCPLCGEKLQPRGDPGHVERDGRWVWLVYHLADEHQSKYGLLVDSCGPDQSGLLSTNFREIFSDDPEHLKEWFILQALSR